ncbi:unnamed protein product [Heligmosomoides polygyrus]|uniref:Uncharacterized protein n=1 Tax=Heligmosomoides polygyrus TaxID=6339 RepID=A0A183FG94_HELPZ|nr:unnamed protein product [Heligmosomoides polygyrus]
MKRFFSDTSCSRMPAHRLLPPHMAARSSNRSVELCCRREKDGREMIWQLRYSFRFLWRISGAFGPHVAGPEGVRSSIIVQEKNAGYCADLTWKKWTSLKVTITDQFKTHVCKVSEGERSYGK